MIEAPDTSTGQTTVGLAPIFYALRTFIMSLVPGVEVVRGLNNNVPMPDGPFISMTPLFQKRLSTNAHVDLPSAGATATSADEQYSVQIDAYGPQSGDWIATISTMFRDEYATNIFGPGVTPLYADDPKQIALINGEEQYEERWSLTAEMQYNPVINTPAQFFTQIQVTINAPIHTG